MIYIFNPDDQLLAVLDNKSESACPFMDAVHTEQLNKEQRLEFTIPGDHVDSAHVKEENQVAFKDLDGNFRLFIIREVTEIDGDELMKEVYCEPAVAELNDEAIEDRRLSASTAMEALTAVLSGTRWQVGTVAELGSTDINFYYENGTSAIQKILNKYGGELRDRVTIQGNQITGKFVDILARRGSDTGKRFEIEKDIQELKRTVRSYPKTALYGRGEAVESGEGYSRRTTFADVVWSTANGDPVDKPAGQEWIGDPIALATYGRKNADGSRRHRFGFVDISDQSDPAVLLRATWDRLQKQKQPLVSYEMKVIDLERNAGLTHEKVRLGDTVFAIDKNFVADNTVEARVIELRRRLDDFTQDELILGNFIPLFTDDSRLEAVEAKLNDGAGVWNQPITDGSFPDTVPTVPANFTATGSFQKIMLGWDFDPSAYVAAYEVYASQIAGFTPDSSNLVWRGKAGGHSFDAGTNAQWYFKARAINTHGTASAFTDEISATTVKIVTDDVMFGSVTADLLDSLAVTAEKLAAGAVTNDKIDRTSVDKIQIQTSDIIQGAITKEKLAANAVGTDQIEAGAINEAKMRWSSHLLF